MRTFTSISFRGQCSICDGRIAPGDRYIRRARHATEEERNDPNVKTFHSRNLGPGPHVSVVAHEECHKNQRNRKKAEVNDQTQKIERPENVGFMHSTIGSTPTPWGSDRIDKTTVLQCMAEEVYACNVANGWFEADRSFGDDIALLHSEVSEMLEAFRDQGTETRLRFASEDGYSLLPEDDPNAVRWMEAGQIPKTEGIAAEAADVLVRLLDTCKRYDIDLFAEWRRKLDYNWTRGHRHGGKNL